MVIDLYAMRRAAMADVIINASKIKGEEQMTNENETEKQIDIPEFLKDKTKTIISMPEPDFKSFMRRFYMDGVKAGTVVGTLRGIIMGAVATGLLYVVYMTCFATHMLPMAGP